MGHIIGMIIAIILFLLGLAGTVLPALPGAPLIWLGMFVYGLFTGFARIRFVFLLLQGVAVGLTFLIDYAGTAYGAKRYGGSIAAIRGSAIGLLLGPLVMGFPGIIIGPFVGALIAEILKGATLERSFRSAFGTLVGLAGATLLKLGIEIVMIIWFFVRVH